MYLQQMLKIYFQGESDALATVAANLANAAAAKASLRKFNYPHLFLGLIVQTILISQPILLEVYMLQEFLAYY